MAQGIEYVDDFDQETNTFHVDNVGRAPKNVREPEEVEEGEQESLRNLIYPGMLMGQGAYVILKEIGSGLNASVWCAYHIETKEFVAIKIQDHDEYKAGKKELKILRAIGDLKRTESEIHLIQIKDFFVHQEEKSDLVFNGERDEDEVEANFVCSVYDMYAGSIYELIQKGKYKYGLPLDVAKNMIHQILIGIEVLHKELKVIHTDIKPENVLFRGYFAYQQMMIDEFKNTKFDEKYQMLCEANLSDEEFNTQLESLASDCADMITCGQAREEGREEIGDEEFYSDDEEYEEDDDPFEFQEEDEDNEDPTSDPEPEEEEIEPTKPAIANVNRRQSVDDLFSVLKSKEIVEIEHLYDFTKKVNNRDITKDPEPVIDDKYVLDNCQIAITDFGNSFFYDRRTRHEVQNRYYRAPECLLGFNFSYPCDIWSLVCLAYELVTGYPLFEPESEPLNRDIHHLYLFEKLLGPVPRNMKEKCPRRDFLFDPKRKLHIRGVPEFTQIPLKQRLVQQHLMDPAEAEVFTDFMLSGLKYDPTERATAAELLAHPWLNKGLKQADKPKSVKTSTKREKDVEF